MKQRTQFRLLDVYRIIQDDTTDYINNIGAIGINNSGQLYVEITRRGRLYCTEWLNVSTIAMRKAAVKQINKRLKEVRV